MASEKSDAVFYNLGGSIMEFFSSLHSEDKTSSELNTLQQGSLFHTIEYELSDIVNKITNINNLDEN